MSVTTLGSIESVNGSMPAAPARLSRRVALDMVTALDVAAVMLGAIVPAWIYAKAGGIDIKWVVIMKAALIVGMIHIVCLRACNMYDEKSLNALPVYPARILATLVLATFAALGVGIPFSVAEVHLWVWYAAWISASFVAALGVRLAARHVLASMTAAGRFDMRVAVYGAGEIARRVQDHLKCQKLGIHFVGVYDDRPRDRVDGDGLDIKGRLEDLIAAARRGAIDQIVISLPQAADKRMSMIAAKLEQLPVSLHMVTHISSDLVEVGPAHKVSAIGGVGLLDIKDKPLTGWQPLVKRIEDVVLGSIFLVLALPLMALVAIAIKLESRGPAIFRQRRRGLNLEVFDVLKFRTMTVMEDGNKVEQAQANDPRVTALGRVLRRFSLDELPQLINVLRGEMSLVGPRPHAVAHDQQWSEMLASYGIRHQVKPGITGLAQVDGWRGEIKGEGDIQGRVADDVAYVRNWSLGLDLAIIARSFGAVISGKNAH